MMISLDHMTANGNKYVKCKNNWRLNQPLYKKKSQIETFVTI